MPAVSWPKMRGGATVPYCIFLMSVGQTPQTATRTSNSSGLMRGTGTVSSRRSFTPRYTTAFMVFGITNIGSIQPHLARLAQTRIPGFGLWTLDFGPWTLDLGLWTLDLRLAFRL